MPGHMPPDTLRTFFSGDRICDEGRAPRSRKYGLRFDAKIFLVWLQAQRIEAEGSGTHSSVITPPSSEIGAECSTMLTW